MMIIQPRAMRPTMEKVRRLTKRIAAEPAAKGEHPIADDHHESDQSNAHEGVAIDGHAAAKEEKPQTHSAGTSAEDGHQADETS